MEYQFLVGLLVAILVILIVYKLCNKKENFVGDGFFEDDQPIYRLPGKIDYDVQRRIPPLSQVDTLTEKEAMRADIMHADNVY